MAGAVAAGVALGLSELLAGFLSGGSSLIAAVGQVAIDLQPPGAKDVMVALFGTNDKLAFELFIVAVGVVAGGALGLLARRRFEVGALGFTSFGVLGFLAALGDPLANPAIVAVLASISVGAGVWILGRFLGPAGRPVDGMPDWSRRAFVIRAGGIGVGAIAAGLVGRGLLERQRSAPVGSGPSAPPASVTVPPLALDADLSPRWPA